MKPGFEGVSDARRRNMQANKHKNTKPEIAVRRALHAEGYRFRVHRRDLPGQPDIVFPSRKAIIEVRGCFWHGHGCRLGQLPKNREAYWHPKISSNRDRDVRNTAELFQMGWRVMEVWECEVRSDLAAVVSNLRTFLGPPRSQTPGEYPKSPEPLLVAQSTDRDGQPPC